MVQVQSKSTRIQSKPKSISPAKPRLFLWFSVLSFISFIAIGYLVIGAIRPAITGFVVARQEADAVVFANRLANNLLLASDFTVSTSTEVEERLSIFLQGLQIPARISVEITDNEGTILISDLAEQIGKKASVNSEFMRVKRELRSLALFRTLSPSEKELLGTAEVFELYIPLTFGTSPQVAGIIHSLSRTGFISQTISNVENDIAMRIGGGFIFLYLVISTIVLGASRTIRHQARALFGYATTLEQKVKERTRDVQAVISSMGEGLVVIDMDERILLMSKSAEEMLEVSLAQAKGKKWSDLVSILKGKEKLPHEEWPSVLALKAGKTIVASLVENLFYRAQSGKTVPIVAVASPLVDEKKIIGVVVVFQDATEEKRLEEARLSFISISSHQLRAPLTSLRWFTELLQEKSAGPVTEKQKGLIGDIYESILRMVDLVNLLLQMARVESGRVKIEPTPLDLKEITRGVLRNIQGVISKKKQKVEINVEPDPFPKILLDKIILNQVIQNILINASQYSEEGKTILISIKMGKDFITYAVKDEGIGIPQDEHNRIFDKFFRASNAMRMVPSGNGLGLSLVRSVVTAWGGSTWFESEEAKGSVFYFTIPAKGMKPKAGEVSLAVAP